MATNAMTLAEIGQRLRVSERTVQRRVRAGEIRAFNVGTQRRPKLRVSEDELQRYIATCRVGRGRAA